MIMFLTKIHAMLMWTVNNGTNSEHVLCTQGAGVSETDDAAGRDEEEEGRVKKRGTAKPGQYNRLEDDWASYIKYLSSLTRGGACLVQDTSSWRHEKLDWETMDWLLS